MRSVLVLVVLLIVGCGGKNSNHEVGQWENDIENWKRTFQAEKPSGVKVINSYFKRTDRSEEIAYFEVLPTSSWKADFIKKYGVIKLMSTDAWDYRSRNHSKMPAWYIPKAAKKYEVEEYDVYDKSGYHGIIYVLKSNGHMFFSLINGRLN